MDLREDRERMVECLRGELHNLEIKRASLVAEIDRVDAWLDGWSAHEALLVEPPMLPAEMPRLKNVKKTVMECFTECTPESWRTMSAVAEYAALPLESVYHCVMREVRNGTIDRRDDFGEPMFRLGEASGLV